MLMEYSPSELASEIGVSVDTIYHTYVPCGCPHRRDDTGHIWIVGTDFADWAREMFAKRRHKMEPGQAWCFKCKEPVRMVGDLEVRSSNRYLEVVIGKCERCGSTVSRARAKT